MGLRNLLNSRLGVGILFILGKTISTRSGFWLADRLGGFFASLRRSEQVRAVRANQWVVGQGKFTKEQLDRVTLEVFRSTARCLFDFYYNIKRPEEIRRRIEIIPEIAGAFESSQKGGGGLVVVAPHLSNFDLAGQAFALRGWPFQVLSYPQPGKGYQWQNQFRSQAGMQVTPMSLVSLRQAKERLKRGGIVLTGMDRPVAGSNYRPKFFGRPAGMPVAYIRLAMETNVPVMVVACQTQPDGSYLVRGSELLWMLPHSNLKAGIETNAERVLKEAEKFICLAPQQWSMTFPVWPEALLEVP